MNFGWTKREKKLAFIFLGCLFLLISIYFYDRSTANPSPSFNPTFNPSTNQADPPTSQKEKDKDKAKDKAKEEEKNQSISVDIKGAVAHPGVFVTTKGARINELIRLAGGLLPEADDRMINQAKVIKDGDLIYIPKRGEKLDFVPGGQGGSEERDRSDRVISINSATLEELNQLPGIGEAKAKAILQYRSSQGAFHTKEDIKKVNGIGEKLFERIKDLITVD